MASLIFISHPEVVVDPETPVAKWGLSDLGRKRATRLAKSEIVSDVTGIWSSTETKAYETAQIVADELGLDLRKEADLGENDRTATGFTPPPEFEAAADAFFAQPETSFRGWESADDAQSRILGCVQGIVSQHRSGDLAVVAHGAVGTLLYCALMNIAINRAHDQPGQGHFWTADLSDLVPRHAWKSIG